MPDTPEQAYESILGKCRPLDGPERQPGTFEIGLVLAGAVSAGAYTAGVLDFLIEALEAWYADKQDGKDVPRHEIKIRVIAGASAGAITGAITATALRYQFPHCRASSIPTVPGPTNPLFDAWVEDIDIRQLLTQNDLADGAAPQSLLDSTCLSRIAAKAIDYAAAPFTPRPYLADPLKLIFTVTNLRGVPYSITMKGNAADGHCMTAHADWLRFAVVGLNGGSSSNPALCPDDILLTYPNSWALQAWQDLGHAALASGAFPFGLQPRMIIRPIADYHYRYTIVPGDAGKPPSVAPLAPCWPATVPGPDYGALHVDGGAMNNEPLELARRELAGPRGRNPREGDAAHRAVVMVDPFPDPAELGPNHPTDLVGTAASLFVAWKEQARFTPEEIALAQDESIFSRFLISPSRGNGSTLSGGFALASGALARLGHQRVPRPVARRTAHGLRPSAGHGRVSMWG